ncbi:TetR/AcrR family transcriptional regulator [Microbacterium sp. RD1]|uniref:TetR/AcrR family transcriptional regulator n=1 Tax=Microbacterium sp. RD1 TaxID=3457313 RepID=UPI003FA55EE7
MREQRRQRMREDIVAATLVLLERDGLDGVSIERIAAQAEMARATIYAHFPDGRDEMLRAAYDAAGRMLVNRARAASQGGATWEERILTYAQTMIDFSRSPTLGSFYSVSGPSLIGFREGGGEGSRGYREDIRAELTAAREAGELSPGADPEALAVLLSSSLRDAGIDAARHPDSAVRYVDAVRYILRGLRAAPPSGQEQS